jgi:prepilin-type N-terminal cleavage/methylation domain-containing protein
MNYCKQNIVKQKGLTLIELMITLAIIACIAFLALQNYNTLNRKNALITFKNQWISALQFAKIAAFRHAKGVYLAPLAKNKDWALGMALFDAQTHRLLYQWHWHYAQLQGKWLGFRSKENLYITPKLLNSAHNGQFIITDCVTNQIIKLTVNRLGRVYEDK